MNRLAAVLAACAAGAIAAGPSAQVAAPRDGKTLDIYVADTEGGKAALYVSPTGETVLIDTGNPGPRDGDRIFAMLTDAGVKRIDHLISTHYHVDHIGGLVELSKRVPIAHYIDHGPTVEPEEAVRGFQAAYQALWAGARHTVVKPGDRVPVGGLDWRIVTSAGQTLKAPLPRGGQPNPACADHQKQPDPPTPDDNAASVGSVVTYGEFRVVDLGDLLWNVEGQLMCPTNPIGTVDVYMVTHHGQATSGAPALVHGVRPRVAIMQNGMRKGGAVAAYEVLEKSPGLEDIWQLHWSHHAGLEHNPAGVFIANVDDAATVAGVLTAAAGGGRSNAASGHTPAHYLKISARSDGTFTVTNTRNGYSKTYQRRRS